MRCRARTWRPQGSALTNPGRTLHRSARHATLLSIYRATCVLVAASIIRAVFDAVLAEAEYVLAPEMQQAARDNIFFLFGRDGVTPLGCGFFIQPDLAITVSHARLDCEMDGIISACTVNVASPRRLRFRIAYDDGDDGDNPSMTGSNLDFMLLSDVDPNSTQTFFNVTSETDTGFLLGNTKVAMLAATIALAGEVTAADGEALLPVGLSVGSVNVHSVGRRHFAYQAQLEGDSGANLLFSKTKTAVGLHTESVNMAKTLHQQSVAVAGASLGLVAADDDHHDDNSDVHARGISAVLAKPSSPTAKRSPKAKAESDIGALAIKTVSASINDLVAAMNSGGVALFLGCFEVQDAIRRVTLGAAGAGAGGCGGGGGGGGGELSGGDAQAFRVGGPAGEAGTCLVQELH